MSAGDNRKISELAASAALTGTELVEVVQSGVNVRTTLSAIRGAGSAVTPLMFNAVGDGVADDSAAWVLAIASGKPIFGGGPGYTYLLGSAVTIDINDAIFIDLQGATVKPSGNHAGFTSSVPVSTVTATVSSGVTLGSRTVVVVGATSLAVGQWVFFFNDDPLYASNVVPVLWAKITGIASTTIELDRPFTITYPTGGTTSMFAYASSAFQSRCAIINGVFDGSASTYDSRGAAIAVQGYKDVSLNELAFKNFAQGGTLHTPLHIQECHDVSVSDAHFVDCVTQSNVLNAYRCRSVSLSGIAITGQGFGINVNNSDMVTCRGISITGQAHYERDESLTLYTVRGLKFEGSAQVTVDGLVANDLRTGLEITNSYRLSVNNVQCINCAYGSSGSLALSFAPLGTTSGQSHISFNNILIENSGGLGFGSTFVGDGRVTITNLHVKNTVSHGVWTTSLPDVHISNAIIENWDIGATGTVGIIHKNEGGSFSNITFLNSDNTKVCFSGALTAGKVFAYSNIRNPDGCTLFTSSKLFVNSGTATIANGATSAVVTHSLLRTPVISEIFLTPGENPTNDPGNVWVDTITATQFTVHCRADPGASAYDIGWRAKLEMPFTA